nr:RNA-directed DNA polymerase, eukaryota, reverse transcriptase zinc-binding domain protein [Tanacetum cinerariifolium]
MGSGVGGDGEWFGVRRCGEKAGNGVQCDGGKHCALHSVSKEDDMDGGMFKGVELGRSMQFSHMFYADDVIFVGKWNDSNIDTLVHVLDCFYRAAGFRINMCKSKLMGISVGEERVNQAASKIGCLALKQGIDVNSFIHKKMGNGEETVFWNEIWCDNEAFKYRYPRLYGLETCKSIDVAAKFAHTSIDHSFRRCPRSGVEQTQLSDLRSKLPDVSLVDARDKWKRSLEGSGDFSVSSIRKLIDDKRLPDVSSKTRWIKVVPIKINIHAWKVMLDYLPTRLNISRR